MKRVLSFCLALMLCLSGLPALANSWGLSGPLLGYVSAVHTWDDYSAQVLYYKRNTDTTAAVMDSRYHNILMVSGPLNSGITHSSTTAVFQPGDKAGRPALTCTDDMVTLSYQDPACSFTFTREAQGERRYLLTHGQKGGITCTLDPEEGILRVNGHLVWQTEPITLEMFNISLFPVTEAEVLQLNRASALLNDASGFWHEADFRNEKTTLPVYSWMDPQSFRAAKGKAVASLKGLVWVMATVDNWALIEYEVSSRTHRTGWVDWTRLTRVAPVMLTSVPAAGAAWMTDDPFVSQYQIKQGNELKDIQLLACLAPLLRLCPCGDGGGTADRRLRAAEGAGVPGGDSGSGGGGTARRHLEVRERRRAHSGNAGPERGRHRASV